SPSLSLHEPAPLFDPGAVITDLKHIAASAGDGDSAKRAVAQRLKAVLTECSAKAEEMLLKERQGGTCAARLCRMQDDIIRVIYTFAVTHLYPSDSPENERM